MVSILVVLEQPQDCSTLHPLEGYADVRGLIQDTVSILVALEQPRPGAPYDSLGAALDTLPVAQDRNGPPRQLTARVPPSEGGVGGIPLSSRGGWGWMNVRGGPHRL